MQVLYDDMFDFLLYEKGEDIIYNNNTTKVLLLDSQEQINYEDDKEIITDFIIKTGDLIKYQDTNWLVYGQVEHHQGFKTYRSRLRKAEQSFKIYLDDYLYEIPGVFEATNQTVTQNSEIILAMGNIKVTVQDNDITRKISYDDTFIKMGAKWKIDGFTSEHMGLRNFYCEKIQFDLQNDDIPNEIADRWKNETTHTYSLSINNGDSIQVLQGETVQLNCTTTDNGAITSQSLPITFTSSDNTVCSVDNKGNILANNVGIAVVNAELTYKAGVKDSINVNVVDTVSHNYSINITANSVLKVLNSATYTVHVYDNGVEVFDQSVLWSVKNVDNSTTPYASITTSTNNACTLKCSSSSYINKVVRLTATLASNPDIIGNLDITIKSLF